MVLFLVLLCLLAVSKPASDDLPPPTELECSDAYDTVDPWIEQATPVFLRINNRYLILIIIIVLFVNLKLKQHYGVNLKPHLFAKE